MVLLRPALLLLRLLLLVQWVHAALLMHATISATEVAAISLEIRILLKHKVSNPTLLSLQLPSNPLQAIPQLLLMV